MIGDIAQAGKMGRTIEALYRDGNEALIREVEALREMLEARH